MYIYNFPDANCISFLLYFMSKLQSPFEQLFLIKITGALCNVSERNVIYSIFSYSSSGGGGVFLVDAHTMKNNGVHTDCPVAVFRVHNYTLSFVRKNKKHERNDAPFINNNN